MLGTCLLAGVTQVTSAFAVICKSLFVKIKPKA
jgi:hypothetical protein